MTTTTETPVRGLLTLTLVPNGSDLCAAVRPSGRNAWPLAVDPLELYWVAFIEEPGQVLWADPANAAPPNQVETSNRRMMIFNSIGDRTPVVSASDTQTLDGQRLVEPDISGKPCGKPKKRAGRATGPACRRLLIAAMTSPRPSAHLPQTSFFMCSILHSSV
jgi:hypothetical protein